MKKIITAVLSICIALCMASCGGEIGSSTDKKPAVTTESKTEISFAGQTAMQSATDSVVTMTQTDTEAAKATTPAPETNELTTALPETTEGTTPAPETTSVTTPAPEATSVTTSAPEATSVTTAAPEATSVTTAAPAVNPDNADTSSKLYYFPYTTNLRDKNKSKVGTIAAGSFYSGHYDPSYEGYVVINYRCGEYLIANSCVIEQQGARILETAAIGQMGGDIYGKAACGPTAATMLVNYQLGMEWTKDELILFCEQNDLNDQGSLTNGGGITAPNLVKLIDSYSGGTVTASDLYGGDPSATLIGLIDNGERSIVVTSYRSGSIAAQPDSPAHFVVVCGYEYIDGELYFYYADPYFAGGGRSLKRVSASTLEASMNYVTKEPRCIITVSNNA